MNNGETRRVKLFADGANYTDIVELAKNPSISGFTTNPTLMRRAGVEDYRSFAKRVLEAVPDRPISFEVFGDEFDEMERQAVEIASWGRNVNVKIPITNTRREFSGDLIERLSGAGVTLNVTAITTLSQIEKTLARLTAGVPCYISVFAGRIADTGRDPVPVMAEAVRMLEARPGVELIWASPREVFNVVQAEEVGCHIITATPDLLMKLKLFGKDLDDYSLETVTMFYRDACAAGYTLGDRERVRQDV